MKGRDCFAARPFRLVLNWSSSAQQLRCAVTIRGVFVGDYKGTLLSTVYLNYCLAHVVAVVELDFKSPVRLIVFEHEQTSLRAKRACSGQGHAAHREAVIARSRVKLERISVAIIGE